MKYGLTNLMKKENDEAVESQTVEVSQTEIEEGVKEDLEYSSAVENAETSLNVLDNLEEIKEGAEAALADDSKTEEEYNDISLKLERDLNSALALVGGSFMSGRYSPSILNPKIENDILTSSGKRQLKMKVEGIKDIAKSIWEKIKAFFKMIWDKISGKEKKMKVIKEKLDAALDQMEEKIDNELKELETEGMRELEENFKAIEVKLKKTIFGMVEHFKGKSKEIEKIFSLTPDVCVLIDDNIKAGKNGNEACEAVSNYIRSKGVKLSSLSFGKSLDSDADNLYVYALSASHVKCVRLSGPYITEMKSFDAQDEFEKIGEKALANAAKNVKEIHSFLDEVGDYAVMKEKNNLYALNALQKALEEAEKSSLDASKKNLEEGKLEAGSDERKKAGLIRHGIVMAAAADSTSFQFAVNLTMCAETINTEINKVAK